MSDELKSFKIGDLATPKGKTTAKVAVPPQAPPSLGFERIEGLLDHEQHGSVSQRMTELVQALEALHSRAPTQREKLATKRAALGVERAAGLIDFLYQTKAQLESGG